MIDDTTPQEDPDTEEEELLFQFHRAYDLLSMLNVYSNLSDPDVAAFLDDPRVQRFLKSG